MGSFVTSIQTSPYGKCIHGLLAGLNSIKHLHITSSLSWQCLPSTLYHLQKGLIHRLKQNLTERPDFCIFIAHMKLWLVQQNYLSDPCFGIRFSGK
jgi:hypothetical protein